MDNYQKIFLLVLFLQFLLFLFFLPNNLFLVSVVVEVKRLIIIMRIANVGGSNSVLKTSYTNIIPDKYGIVIDNRGVGSTNSIYALLNIMKYNLIEQNDLLIFEYFVNDSNHFFQGINNVERISKTLVEIVKMCIHWKTKLLFVLIYNKTYQLEKKYET